MMQGVKPELLMQGKRFNLCPGSSLAQKPLNSCDLAVFPSVAVHSAVLLRTSHCH